MNKNYTIKLTLLLPAVILILFLVNISLGSVHIPLDEIFQVLIGGETSKGSWTNIITTFRLPKALTAVLVGAGLAVSGLQMQTLFRNPLAGPFVLGISSGASLGVALLLLAGVSITSGLAISGLGNWLVVLAATAGSSLVLVLVVAVSVRVRDSMTLLIIGLMFGSLTGAIVSILQFFSTGEEIQLYLFWTFGSLGGLNWNEVYILLALVLAGLFIAVTLVKSLNTLLLSENYARSMGVNVKKSRLWIIISTSLLAGSVTAFCGPIAFIGLAVPHLTRLLVNTSDHKIMIPAVALTGIIVMLVCDVVAQIPYSDHVLPINAITSLIGAPVVIWIILRKGTIKHSFS
ncbi:Vitamin B12 ABC transporter, permease component BtuC [Fulvivirga imtechensis AK7]|uniref:Vitamin B12 ABC transporter, permease component BtuC n=1 Tax=Fulvivirga imtechensis AK7 TaxID=1237149 RepID=L8JMR6_9BACT|nr:iron ABC transporter permease [Fulvivirga imtechensis]ELR70125.1 Vitamin B12 ABC transporter, permease component BtuC [Fulvivirga imtechensis AK7]